MYVVVLMLGGLVICLCANRFKRLAVGILAASGANKTKQNNISSILRIGILLFGKSSPEGMHEIMDRRDRLDEGISAMAYGSEYTPLEGLTSGSRPVANSQLPFSSELKRALQATIEAADTVGSNHVGPEHLLAGLARDEDSQAGAILAGMGITYDRVLAVIKDSAPAPSPTAARTCDVYLPVGKSIFKNGAKIYPDLATAQAAHPDEEIAPFTFPLHEGEFFDVGTVYPRYSSWGMFASYPDAYTAAQDFRNVQGADVQIRIMAPRIQELRGKDSRGNDVILGRNIEYTRTRIMSRLWEAHDDTQHLRMKRLC